MRKSIRSVLAGVLLAGATSAAATPFSFGFQGSVTDDPFGLTTFGAPIVGDFLFDSTAIDAIPGPATGSFSSLGPGFVFNATIDGVAYSVAGSVIVNTANDIAGGDQYGVIAENASLRLELFFQDPGGTALSSDALPLAPPAVGAFAIRQFRLFSAEAEFLGTIDTLSCLAGCGAVGTVPEPWTPLLLVLGASVAWLSRRPQRRI